MQLACDCLLHHAGCLEHLFVTFAYAVGSATLMPCERFGSFIWELKVDETKDGTWLPADIRILTMA